MPETIEKPALNELLKIETNGVKIDQNFLESYSKELSLRIDKLQKQAYKIAGEEFNLDSPKQLLEILFNKLGLPILKKLQKDSLPPTRKRLFDYLKNMNFQKLFWSIEV